MREGLYRDYEIGMKWRRHERKEQKERRRRESEEMEEIGRHCERESGQK